MTLRIHFTAEDLARTCLASGARPLLELEIGIRLLQERSHPVRFDAWRRRAATHLHPLLEPLFCLVPALGASAAFLDLSGPGVPHDLVERLRSTPEHQVTRDLDQWAGAQRSVPKSARALRQDPSLIRHVADAVEYAHEHFVAPYWPRIEQLAAADRTWRLKRLAEHGVGRLLQDVNPRCITWRPPVLHVTTASGIDHDLHLEGRGLLLVPSVFGAHYPAFDHPEDGRPWITFPVRDSTDATHAPAAFTADALTGAPAALRALLGRTRATVLYVIADHPGCSTTHIAARARVSPASASEHTTVLRNAGLTSLTRAGKQALHSLSPAGQALLNSVKSP
ncbi:ArsR/SmtB family transcription factor [Streptomyces sp. NPDC050504]|uniref:ArsR/SmtB family transcription factor n=1 Tax=Streptomyces sp. NPDC050504 TaxID=3365618 RepID=UPI0037927673